MASIKTEVKVEEEILPALASARSVRFAEHNRVEKNFELGDATKEVPYHYQTIHERSEDLMKQIKSLSRSEELLRWELATKENEIEATKKRAEREIEDIKEMAGKEVEDTEQRAEIAIENAQRDGEKAVESAHKRAEREIDKAMEWAHREIQEAKDWARGEAAATKKWADEQIELEREKAEASWVAEVKALREEVDKLANQSSLSIMSTDNEAMSLLTQFHTHVEQLAKDMGEAKETMRANGHSHEKRKHSVDTSDAQHFKKARRDADEEGSLFVDPPFIDLSGGSP